MKEKKRHLLRALATAAEESIEESIAKLSGYANAEAMQAGLAKALFAHPDVKKAVRELHARAASQAKAHLKTLQKDVRKNSGRVQASRLQPRGRER